MQYDKTLFFWQVHLGAVLLWFILVKENNFSIQVARKRSLDNASLPPVHADACAAEFGRGACLLCFDELILVGIFFFINQVLAPLLPELNEIYMFTARLSLTQTLSAMQLKNMHA